MTHPPQSAGVNAAQIEYWNGRAGERWASWQERLDRGMEEMTEALLAFALPQSGERVLDIGCGCGTTSLRIAPAVAPAGRVIGVDISAPMLVVAQTRASAAVAVEFVRADASVYPFTADHDLLLSRFGVMFFDDPVAAFRNLRMAAQPGARLVFLTWREFRQNSWAFDPYQAALPLLPPQEPTPAHAPGPFAFSDPGRVHQILRDAGYARIEVEPLDVHMQLGATIPEAVDQSLHIGPLAKAAAGVDRATRALIVDRIDESLRPWSSETSGVRAPAACWLVRAFA